MGDLIDIIVKLGSMEPSQYGRIAIRFIRFVMLLVFSVLLYRTWVGDFSIVTSVEGILEYFLSARFLYSVLVYLFVLACEFIGMLVITKLNAIMFVSEALKLVEKMRNEIPTMSEDDKKQLRLNFNKGIKFSAGGLSKWLGEEYEHEKVTKQIRIRPSKIYPERMDGLGLFSVEIYIYLLATGHSWTWGLLLLFFLPLFACLKALLLIVKNALPVLVEPKNGRLLEGGEQKALQIVQ